ncbi:MAG: hypothetical protein AAFP90_14820 [Planctomycetota bacterium]
MTSFGTTPYRGCHYGDKNCALADASGEIGELQQILTRLKNGSFEAVSDLVPFTRSASFDVRQYAQQLLAHVCTNEQVIEFQSSIESVEEIDEACRLAIRLGESLSINGVDLLLNLREDFQDGKVNDFVFTGLRVLLPLQSSDCELDDDELRQACSSLMSTLPRDEYFYRGEPVAIGEICKELITLCLVANREKKSLVAFRQPQILSNFSGIICPVEHGQNVDDAAMNKVFDYVEVLSKMAWEVGKKYFYQQSV